MFFYISPPYVEAFTPSEAIIEVNGYSVTATPPTISLDSALCNFSRITLLHYFKIEVFKT